MLTPLPSFNHFIRFSIVNTCLYLFFPVVRTMFCIHIRIERQYWRRETIADPNSHQEFYDSNNLTHFLSLIDDSLSLLAKLLLSEGL